MKNIFDLFNKKNKNNSPILSSISMDENKTRDTVLSKQFKNGIKIENNPFRLSGLFHELTNKVATLIEDNRHILYYDVENNVGRYIVGDNDYLEQVLCLLMEDALLLNKDSEVILKVSNSKNKFLVFEIINENGIINKEDYRQYLDVCEIIESQSENLNNFVKVKIIVDAMGGSIELKSKKSVGTHYIFKIPYYEDENDKSHQKELKDFLIGKQALFIGRDKYDTKRTQYIFKTYGIDIHNMQLNDFENKKPNLSKYDMAIIRSADLSYKHISFFKNIFKDHKSDFKIIIVHELFEDEEKIKLAKPIGNAELYCPTVIGDVEEVLYQIFILNSKSVKGINNIDNFNRESFIIRADIDVELNNLEHYAGARIAIVEDSKVDEKILQNILMHEEITLFCMHDGSEMLDLLEREEIDIIFTDINMSIMDGILMTKKIRTMNKYNKIPIISISSMAFLHELRQMELAGINAAITKPIEAKDIYLALNRFLIMTEEMRMRKKNTNQINFLFNKEVLDVSKGIEKSKSDLEYVEKLLQTIEYLRDSRESFENMIHEEEFMALGKYTRTALSMYEDICAPDMVKMFKDLTYFISQRQRKYLVDYISLYQHNWDALDTEVEKYTSGM